MGGGVEWLRGLRQGGQFRGKGLWGRGEGIGSGIGVPTPSRRRCDSPRKGQPEKLGF
jgi:hypothetical protein